ncbi:hypothetical protein E4U41_007155 [Claviceps citrina]|nr:hypothetical protein E4U41_007155 [Claviceps citrina]
MLDVYIWGPAFGLPSIDPECLALLLYMQNALPGGGGDDDDDVWRIIPCNDPSVSPSNLLPALNHNGRWTSGYLPIVEYDTKRRARCGNNKKNSNSNNHDTHEGLSPAQQADATAYCAFLTANAAPLVYLSLYVSAANWSTTTRPAYSSLLPFPLTWTLPPLIRAEAIGRAEHLGLAELDTDFDPNGGLHLTAGRDALPETFRRHLPARTKKPTVRGEMTPEQAAAIRLSSLAEDCLSVLNALMASQADQGPIPCFFPNRKAPTSADCLAYAYLALMTVPPVPRPFLRDYMDAGTPRLAVVGEWVRAARCRDVVPLGRNPTTLLESAARVADSIVRNMPSIGEHYADEMRYRREAGITGLDRRALIMAMGLLVTGAAVGYGLQLYRSLGPFGSRTQIWRRLLHQQHQHQQGSKLSQFGDLGSMLNSAMGAYEPAGHVSASGRLVDVDSEVD